MKDKVKLSQASMIVTLGIVLALITVYFPFLGILSLAIPIPYAIIGTITNKKYSVLSLIITFFILMFTVNITYALNISILRAIPGIIIGIVVGKNIKEGSNNKFEPVLTGTIAMMLSTVAFFILFSVFFKIDLLDRFMDLIKTTVTQQVKVLNSSGVDVSSLVKTEDLINFIYNLLPTMLFLQGIVRAFFTYYLEVFILRRTKTVNLESPKFTEFYLPGNPVMVSLILYMLVFLVDGLGLNFHGDLVIMNLQTIFSIMFIIQGVAVSVHYLKNWLKTSQIKKIFISGLVLCIFGFMGISFLGMLDSVIDFRKIRSYKSV